MSQQHADQKPLPILEFSTTLEIDLRPYSFRAQEGLSRLFRFEVEMMSDDNDIPEEHIVGANVTVSLRLSEHAAPRYFNGFVSTFSRGREDEQGRRRYCAEVVPWLWFLSQSSDCRIFQNKDVKQIVKEVFEELGYQESVHFDLGQVRGEHRQREYCVQYRETALSFVLRLLEEEGIFYSFRHAQGSHILVLADQKCAYTECPDAEVEYLRTTNQWQSDRITDWNRRHRYRTGSWVQSDFDFKRPKDSLLTPPEPAQMRLAGAERLEFFDYPGKYEVLRDGKSLTRIRMEEEEAGFEEVHGASTYDSFEPGAVIHVKSHPSASECSSFVITSVHHMVEEGKLRVSDRTYRNRFSCIPASTIFRPERRTPKPCIPGLQTAIVVGPKEQEVYTDPYGRVKVQFPWDRYSESDDRSSCWIRVAQFSAGQGWGAHFWPRAGHEVVVAFLEGDPDRPLIVGSVYNGSNLPPYALPEHQTRSGIKTRSTPGGGPDDFNEIRFEDRTGHEQLYIHAERNLDTVVESSETRRVGGNRSTTIGQDDKLTVREGNREVEVLEGDQILFVQKGNAEHQAPAGMYRIAAKEVWLDAAEKLSLTCGGSSITLEPGKITLAIGGSSIALDPASIVRQAIRISDQAAVLHETKGSIVTSESASIHSTKGMLVENTGIAVSALSGGLVKVG